MKICNMKIYKIFILSFIMSILMSCTYADEKNVKILSNDSTLIGKYKTEYVIYYAEGHNYIYTIYSDKEVYTCSFQGTNFLLEKDNTEEILSTTAPIRIRKSEIVK